MTDWLLQASNAQAEIDHLRLRLERLEKFYQEVQHLCLHHDVVHCVDGNAYASISPRKLNDVLSNVDENWYNVKKYLIDNTD